MLIGHPESGFARRCSPRPRWRAVLAVGSVVALAGWTSFADDSVARTINVAGERSIDLVTATGTRIVNMVDAAVSAVKAAIAIASSVADIAAQIVDSLSRLTSVLG